jgi:septal ring-binding cell division protein DamX
MTEDLARRGKFEERPFPVLLKKIKDSGKTGLLLANKGEVEKRIFFQNGEPIASRSNIRKDLLGEILCARGKISGAQLDEAILESKKKTGDNFGQILVKKDFLTPKDLYSECKYQFISILFSLFSWEYGTYYFQEHEASLLIPPDLPRFHVKFSKFLSEGIRLIKNEDFIDRILGDTGLVVQPTATPVLSQDLSFKGEEKVVHDELPYGKTIQEIVDSLAHAPFVVKKVLYTLFCLGAVKFQAPAPVVEHEAEEELPALSESSLSAFMSDIMPEDRAEDRPDELPVFEGNTAHTPDAEEMLAGGMGEIDDLLPSQMDTLTEKESLLTEEGVEEEVIPGPLEDQAVPVLEESVPQEETILPGQEDLLSETMGEKIAMDEEQGPFEPVLEKMEPGIDEEASVPLVDEPMLEVSGEEVLEDKKEAFSPEQEEILAQTMEEMAEAGLDMGREDSGGGKAGEVPEGIEEPPLGVAEEETVKEMEAILPPEQEEVFTESTEKEADGAAFMAEQEKTPEPAAEPVMEIKRKKKKKKRKKSSSLVPVTIILGVLVLGGLALFYFLRAKEPQTTLLAKQEQERTITEKVEVESPEEVVQELASEEVSEKEPAGAPSEPEEKKPEVIVPGLPPEEKPEESPDTAVKQAAPLEEVSPAEERPPSVKKDVSPPPEPPASWKDLYTKGMTHFQDGKLNSAFKAWKDVIRFAPDHAYSIQIEITSYLNYASRDIKESSPDEDVFIVTTLLKDKAAYKVLCGIYEDRNKAEKALQNLSPYLKAQKPALVKVDRLKQKLVD